MGIVEVAALATRVGVEPDETIISSLGDAASSAACAGKAIKFAVGKSPFNGQCFFPPHSLGRAYRCGMPRLRADSATGAAIASRPIREIFVGCCAWSGRARALEEHGAQRVRTVIFFFMSFEGVSNVEFSLLNDFIRRANTFGGIVRAICFAVFNLIISSSFVGCSTGKLPTSHLSQGLSEKREIGDFAERNVTGDFQSCFLSSIITRNPVSQTLGSSL